MTTVTSRCWTSLVTTSPLPMTLDLVPPADAALPPIRTSRRDLWWYAASNELGAQMRGAVALLEVAIAAPEELVEEGVRPPTLAELYTIVHKALASALKVIAPGPPRKRSDARASALRRTTGASPVHPHAVLDWPHDHRRAPQSKMNS